jgi:hypothetical protein
VAKNYQEEKDGAVIHVLNSKEFVSIFIEIIFIFL